MYEEFHYVADATDESAVRDYIRSLDLTVIPERPGGEVALSDAEIKKNRRRLLSLGRIEKLEISYTDPYPHYSPARQPLLEWDVSQVVGKVIVTGYIRHHEYMEKDGPGFVEIGKAFAKIRAWMKLNWGSVNKFDFIGPGAAALIRDGAYTWSCFDPENTTFAIIWPDGKEEEVTHEEWVNSSRNS